MVARGWKLVALVAALLALAPVASAAGRGPSVHLTRLPIPADAQYAGDDGASHIVYAGVAYGSSATLLDLRTGVATPIPQPPAQNCTVVGRPGGLGAMCGDRAPLSLYVRRYDAAEWSLVPLDQESLVDADQVQVTGIGRSWIALLVAGYHFADTRYVPWTGGPMVSDYALGPNAIPNLDRPSGQSPICAPLSRDTGAQPAEQSVDLYAPFIAVRPWALSAHIVATGDPADVIAISLHHCGTSKVTTLCSTVCSSPALSRSLAAWAGKDGVMVRNLKTRRTTRIRIPGMDPGYSTVHLVGDRILVTGYDPETQRNATDLVRIS